MTYRMHLRARISELLSDMGTQKAGTTGDDDGSAGEPQVRARFPRALSVPCIMANYSFVDRVAEITVRGCRAMSKKSFSATISSRKPVEGLRQEEGRLPTGMTKTALITGITGQDGSYLAELLLSKGYEVHGVVRRASTFNSERLDDIYEDPHTSHRRLFLHYGDLSDSVGLVNLVRDVAPSEVYHLGAQSHVKVSFETPVYTANITGIGTIRLLEAIRATGVDTRFYQASSSEMFGAAESPQSERTPFHPRSPYGVAKLFGYWATINYREAYGMFAVNGVLFNHESPRRGETFVTRKITRAAARIKAGLQERLYLGNLDAVRDWGYAPEYVEGMWRMLQAEAPSDYCLATGIGASVREFADAAFAALDLNWKDYIQVDEQYLRPVEIETLIGDSSYAKSILGWSAQTTWKELANLMALADWQVVEDHLSGLRVRVDR